MYPGLAKSAQVSDGDAVRCLAWWECLDLL